MTIVCETIDNKRLMRGPRPKSETEFKMLRARTVINLETGWFEVLHGRNFQLDRWADFTDVSIVHLPLSAFHHPTEEQVKLFLAYVKNALNCGDVFFGCLQGKDRTGYMCAQYRMRVQGWSREKAIAEMYADGFHRCRYGSWVKYL